ALVEGRINTARLSKAVWLDLVRSFTTGNLEWNVLQLTRSERVIEQPVEPPLSEGHTSGSGEGRMEYQFELMANVLDLEKEKDAQAMEILRLTKRFKRLERQRTSSTSQPRRRQYKQVESSEDDLDEEDASKQGRSRAEEESTMAFKLIKFIKSMLEE
ncbi:hypothetical protein Tco_1322986, partial [Tanacetum coccineum]